jgi:hypothetical protein
VRFLISLSSMNQIICINEIFEKTWKYSVAFCLLCIDFQKACDSHRTRVVYDILIEFYIPMKLNLGNENVFKLSL